MARPKGVRNGEGSERKRIEREVLDYLSERKMISPDDRKMWEERKKSCELKHGSVFGSRSYRIDRFVGYARRVGGYGKILSDDNLREIEGYMREAKIADNRVVMMPIAVTERMDNVFRKVCSSKRLKPESVLRDMMLTYIACNGNRHQLAVVLKDIRKVRDGRIRMDWIRQRLLAILSNARDDIKSHEEKNEFENVTSDGMQALCEQGQVMFDMTAGLARRDISENAFSSFYDDDEV